jgi:hypothetical protein
MTDQEPKAVQTATGITYKRLDNFDSRYANNILFESSLWDLKLIFGQNDGSLGPNSVVQFGAITLPWAQVKLLSYFCRVHLAIHEVTHGRIPLDSGLVLPVPEEVPAFMNTPTGKQAHEALKAIYQDFVSNNPEVASPKTT